MTRKARLPMSVYSQVRKRIMTSILHNISPGLAYILLCTTSRLQQRANPFTMASANNIIRITAPNEVLNVKNGDAVIRVDGALVGVKDGSLFAFYGDDLDDVSLWHLEPAGSVELPDGTEGATYAPSNRTDGNLLIFMNFYVVLLRSTSQVQTLPDTYFR